jgi:hypothetical protein
MNINIKKNIKNFANLIQLEVAISRLRATDAHLGIFEKIVKAFQL